MNNMICVALVRKPQGIKGEVKVSVLLDNPSDIRKLDKLYTESGEELNIVRIFQLGQDFGIGFKEFSNPEQTLKIKGQKLYANRDVIHQIIGNNNFFIEDLINKTAIFENGEVLGKITDIENYGSADVVFVDSKLYTNLSFANTGNIFIKLDEKNSTVVLNKENFMATKVCDQDEGERDENWYFNAFPRNVWCS